MAKLEVNIEGRGGAFAERLRGRQIMDARDGEVLIETLEAGMISGEASVGIIILVDEQQAVIARVTLRQFQLAAVITLGKYGDVTGGGLVAKFDPTKGQADIRLSDVTTAATAVKRSRLHTRFVRTAAMRFERMCCNFDRRHGDRPGAPRLLTLNAFSFLSAHAAEYS